MYTPSALLDAVIKILERDKSDVLISTWFDDAQAIAIKDGSFVVQTSSELKRETLNTRFTDNVSEAIFELTGERYQVVYLCGEEEAIKWRTENDESIYSQYTFERFIVGNSNKFAHAAAYAVSQKPAAAYNPLFIYGQSGLGKTHLLYAIAGEIRKARKTFKIVYVKGDDFTNELVDSIQNHSFPEFRGKYRQADLLLVDDIQFIAGKVQTQEEFFHTFNTLHEAGKQIVLTSDRPPREIYTLEDRLRTRFEWGLLADIQPPDIETRMALVKAKAQMLEIKLPNDVVEYIASNITNNVRQLEGVVKSMAANHMLMNKDLDMSLAQEAIRDVIRISPGLHPTPDLILEEVADFYSVPPDRIKGKAKTRDVVLPRQVTIYLIRELTELSLPDIGKFIGRDHTTAMYAINKLTERLTTDESLQNAIKDMKKNIRSR